MQSLAVRRLCADMADALRFDSPEVLALTTAAEQRNGLPAGLLTALITRGEKSNSDQVSEAGARGLGQIIPATRKAAIDQFGVDPYLSNENSVDVAAKLLKQNLDANKGDVPRAVATYHGGTDENNWGPRTQAYVKRVTGALPADAPAAPAAAEPGAAPASDGPSTFEKLWGAANAPQPHQVANILKAYQGGQMAPEDKRAFEADVKSGKLMLPQGASLMPDGMVAQGNIDMNARPRVKNADGSISTVRSLGINVDGQEVLVPTVSDDGRIMTNDEAIDMYRRTGRHLGKFANEAASSAFAQQLHNSEATKLDGQPSAAALPQGVVDAFNAGKITGKDREQLLADVAAGHVAAPPGSQLELTAKFPNRDYRNIIPGQAGVQKDEQGRPFVDTTPNAPETISDKIMGAGEAVLSAVTGIAGYGAALNSTGATLVNAGINKLQGGPELPDTMERDSTAAGQRFTYAPRTDAGQRMAQSMGDAMQPLAGLAPAEAAAMHAGAGSVVGTVRQVARGVPGGAIDAARTLGQAATDDPAVARAASEVPIQPEGAPAPSVPAAPASPPAAAVPPVAPMTAAELAQATRTAAGGGLGSDKAMHAVAGQVAPDAATVAAAKRLGVEDYLQPDHVTTNQAYRELAQAVKSIPGSEAHAAEISGLGRVGQRASALVDEIGGTRDLAELSGDVKKRLQGSADEMGGQADRLWGQLRDEVPNATKTATPATTAVLQRAVSDLGGEAEALKALPPAASKFLRPMMSGEDVTHGYLDNARKQVGQAMQKGSGPFADMEQGQLKQIYAALSQDQENVARRTSPDAYYTFQAAKYATRLQKGFEDDLSSLFGRELDRSFVGAGANSLHGAVSAASKGDSSKMISLLQSVPPEMRQNVVASGVGSIFRNAATRGEIDFGSYARWYEGLQRNRQAYGAVMSNLPLEARKQLAALHRVSAGISAATRERITTGRIQAVKDELKGPDNLISRIYDVARRSSAGLAAEAVTTPLGLPGSGLSAGIASALVKGKTDALKAADALISSQEFANATKRTIQDPAMNKVTAKALARSPAFLRFMHAISGAAPDASGGEGWILSAIQADAVRNPAPPTDH